MTLAERLNREVWCKLGVSSIHGVGVIAIRAIPKGQRIYAIPDTDVNEWLDRVDLTGLHPAIAELINQRWPLQDEPFLSPNQDQRLLSFVNHSTSPNYSPKTDCALVDIPAGIEITENYGEYAPVDNS